MIVWVLTTCHLVFQMQPHVIYFYGYVKEQVYDSTLPASIPELKVRIRTPTETITADMLQTVWNELDYIYLFIYCNWVVTRWQWLFYM